MWACTLLFLGFIAYGFILEIKKPLTGPEINYRDQIIRTQKQVAPMGNITLKTFHFQGVITKTKIIPNNMWELTIVPTLEKPWEKEIKIHIDTYQSMDLFQEGKVIYLKAEWFGFNNPNNEWRYFIDYDKYRDLKK